ncbi:MAG: PKD domain-containing protein [Saprospiraceae bacterium]|jgi:PKD repeat protein|nr:PKD domain-containing protein [Saprospiraceae bacterium]
MKNTYYLLWALLLIVVGTQISCKDEDEPEVLSSFTYEVDAVDFKKVTFTNEAQNYSKLEWDFGDGTAISVEENPVHVYAAIGTYTVTLTATSLNGNNTDVFTQELVLSDPNAELTKLVGDVSKTWILLREVGSGRYPLEVGPIDRSTIWWAQGLNNDELALRPCILNDEWTFGRDGSMKYNSNGDFWAEGGVFEPANLCQETNATNLVGPGGIDLSAFGDGNHTFTLDNKLTVSGLGAFVGLPKIGTDTEVKVPQQSVTYDIIKLSDGAVDTLILESAYKFDAANPTDDAYWRIVLVHYDDPAQTPPIPLPAPAAGFTAVVDGLTVTLTNTSTNGLSYLWEFGDGNTSTATNPTHTYATGGIYNIKLTATNNAGSSSASQEAFTSAQPLSDALLQGGAWKIRNAENSIFVGPGLGSNAWWKVPANFLDGSSTGGDDWSCIANDEFIFAASGVYQYKTNGDARNDGYMNFMTGFSNGCLSDAELALSGNGAAFGSAIHSYVFTPASGSDRAVITLTNGAPNKAAFLGFYKGYYGGENSDGANPPNGGNTTNKYEVIGYAKSPTKEYLFVSVDISADHSGGAAWSMVLER